MNVLAIDTSTTKLVVGVCARTTDTVTVLADVSVLSLIHI